MFWVTAMFALAVTDPSTPHYSLCVFRLLGWHHCPGCGLGHAIAYFIRGDFKDSFQSHFLGIPAFFIILHRIAVLGVPFYIKIKQYFYGSKLSLIPARS